MAFGGTVFLIMAIFTVLIGEVSLRSLHHHQHHHHHHRHHRKSRLTDMEHKFFDEAMLTDSETSPSTVPKREAKKFEHLALYQTCATCRYKVSPVKREDDHYVPEGMVEITCLKDDTKSKCSTLSGTWGCRQTESMFTFQSTAPGGGFVTRKLNTGCVCALPGYKELPDGKGNLEIHF